MQASRRRQAVNRQMPNSARSREVCKPWLKSSCISACVRIFALPCLSIFKRHTWRHHLRHFPPKWMRSLGLLGKAAVRNGDRCHRSLRRNSKKINKLPSLNRLTHERKFAPNSCIHFKFLKLVLWSLVCSVRNNLALQSNGEQRIIFYHHGNYSATACD